MLWSILYPMMKWNHANIHNIQLCIICRCHILFIIYVYICFRTLAGYFCQGAQAEICELKTAFNYQIYCSITSPDFWSFILFYIRILQQYQATALSCWLLYAFLFPPTGVKQITRKLDGNDITTWRYLSSLDNAHHIAYKYFCPASVDEAKHE